MLKVCNLRNSQLIELITLVLLTLLALLTWLVPDWLSQISPTCLFSYFFDFKYCWGCGLTRATIALMNADLIAAWQLNPLVFIVVPLIIFEYFRLLKRVLHSWII
jgi:hypothetical protein